MMRVPISCVVVLFAWTTSIEAQAPPPVFPPITDQDAWMLLPSKLPGKPPQLPVWARVLVQPLPKTTGAMLDLDYLHRAKNPLDQVLAAKLRWATAHALGSVYGQRYAEADLRRAGVGDDELKQLTGALAKLPAADRAAVGLARKMSLAAASVTDDEIVELIRLFGPEQTVALVHTLAYANFHERIVMALGVAVEASPLPPVDPQLDPVQRAKISSPPRPAWTAPKADATLPDFRLDWRAQSIGDLAEALDRQKARAPRLPLPAPERLAKLPKGVKEQAERIVWMTVSMGYQPRLTAAWFDCLRAYQSEAAFDRVFSNSVFWVITRSNDCFY